MRRALAVLTLLVFAACNDESPTAPQDPNANPPGSSAGQPVSFTLVYADIYSGIRAPRQELVVQPARWQAVWDEIMSDGRSPKPPIPSVDFDRNMLIVAGLGYSPDACMNVDVESVRLAGDILQVAIKDVRSPMSCTCPPVTVQPVRIVAVPRVTTKVAFTRRSVTEGRECN
jgi:hypothetical protein